MADANAASAPLMPTATPPIVPPVAPVVSTDASTQGSRTLPAPDKWTGTPENAFVWVTWVRRFISVNDHLFNSEERKMQWAGLGMSSKATHTHWYTNACKTYKTFEALADAFLAQFGQRFEQPTVLHQLQHMKQNGRPIMDYWNEFYDLTMRMNPPLDDLWGKTMFQNGLDEYLRKAMLNLPNIFTMPVGDLVSYASAIEANHRASRLAPPALTPIRTVPVPTPSVPAPRARSDFVPMEVDATSADTQYQGKLTPALRQKLVREGRCFYCRKSGHQVGSCNLKVQNDQQRSGRHNGIHVNMMPSDAENGMPQE